MEKKNEDEEVRDEEEEAKGIHTDEPPIELETQAQESGSELPKDADIPKTVVEEAPGDVPSHTEEWEQKHSADAEPDQVIPAEDETESEDVAEETASIEAEKPTIEEYDEEEDNEEEDNDDFGDDFDDFEEGGQDDDFDDFEVGFQEPAAPTQAPVQTQAPLSFVGQFTLTSPKL